MIYSRFSNALSQQERDDRDVNGAPVPAISDYEMVLELTYQANWNNWWYVQPDLQLIIQPGGSAARSDAWVVGLRTGLRF